MTEQEFVEQFGAPLAAAQHADKVSAWPWHGRLIHRLFLSHRCPACIYWKGLNASPIKAVVNDTGKPCACGARPRYPHTLGRTVAYPEQSVGQILTVGEFRALAWAGVVRGGQE